MANKKKTQDETPDAMDITEATPEVQETMKIKVVDFKTKREPGTVVTLYGIKFTVMKNGEVVGETLPAIAQAGIKAGLYKKA
jgi:hypothetical protein